MDYQEISEIYIWYAGSLASGVLFGFLLFMFSLILRRGKNKIGL